MWIIIKRIKRRWDCEGEKQEKAELFWFEKLEFFFLTEFKEEGLYHLEISRVECHWGKQA